MPTTDPLDEVAVANMAIDVLDDVAIADLDQGGPVAEFMRRNFGPTRDEILQQFPWPFAKKYQYVGIDSDGPPFGWDYAYTLPTDCIEPYPIRYEGKWSGNLIVYEIVGRKIYTNHEAPLPLIYKRKVTNMAEWTPLAARVLAMQLAVYGAQNITGKRSYVEKAAGMLSAAREEARLTESLSAGTPEPQSRHDIIDFRGRGFGT